MKMDETKASPRIVPESIMLSPPALATHSWGNRVTVSTSQSGICSVGNTEIAEHDVRRKRLQGTSGPF